MAFKICRCFKWQCLSPVPDGDTGTNMSMTLQSVENAWWVKLNQIQEHGLSFWDGFSLGWD